MATIEEELEAVESTLKNCAEELGWLNVDNNRLQEVNQQISLDIQKVQLKIDKKTHSLEQEAKDKKIIHHQLVKAEQVKEQIEIEIEKRQARREQEQTRVQQEIERKVSQQKQAEAQRLAMDQRKKSETTVSQTPGPKAESQKQSSPVPQKPSEPLNAFSVPSKPKVQPPRRIVPKPVPVKSQTYQNTEKGQYEPPALFLDDNDSDSSSGEDNSKVLQKLKQKLQQDKEQLDHEDD